MSADKGGKMGCCIWLVPIHIIYVFSQNRRSVSSSLDGSTLLGSLVYCHCQATMDKPDVKDTAEVSHAVQQLSNEFGSTPLDEADQARLGKKQQLHVSN